jgi:hypothetical protein
MGVRERVVLRVVPALIDPPTRAAVLVVRRRTSLTRLLASKTRTRSRLTRRRLRMMRKQVTIVNTSSQLPHEFRNDDVIIMRARFYLALGFVVLGGLASLAVAAPVPTYWSPYPAAFFLPLSAGASRPVIMLGLSTLFVVWNLRPAVRPYCGRLWYLAGPAAVMSVANVVYLAVRAADGNVHQGTAYVAFVTVINILLMAAFWLTWNAWRSRATSARAVMLGFLLFAWLVSYSFPYMGEGI